MLRALKQLLRSGGRIALTTIYVAPGLSPTARRKATRSGPRAVASRSAPPTLLTSAGFVDVEAFDLTEEFADCARSWVSEWEDHAAVLAPLEPAGAYEERQRDRRIQLAAIEAGLLRRGLFAATRP